VFKAPRPARPAAAAPSAPRRIAEPTALAAAPQPSPVRYIDEAPGMATVLTLGAHMCKWPIGDPASDGFTFCGRRSDREGPYCNEHARVAYQPQQQKKGRSGASDLARSLRRYI
jgi:GcrA cell cycle regulator